MALTLLRRGVQLRDSRAQTVDSLLQLAGPVEVQIGLSEQFAENVLGMFAEAAELEDDVGERGIGVELEIVVHGAGDGDATGRRGRDCSLH